MSYRWLSITLTICILFMVLIPDEAQACYPSCSSTCNSQTACSTSCDGLIAAVASSTPVTPMCNSTTCGAYGICQGMGGSYCGDGICASPETCSSCPGDCGSCSYCGDQTCTSGTETCASCPGDCGTCHYWYCSGSTPWHYADRNISWYNNGVGDYYNVLQEEALTDFNSWHNYTDVNFTQVFSAGSTDHLHGYSGFYGTTGWLGLATIYRNNACVVLEGHALLNRSYLDGYSRTNQKHVACQEVAHLLGLAHNRSQTNTCMNDTILTAPNPNTRDRDALNAIY